MEQRRKLAPDEVTRIAAATTLACAAEPGVRFAYLHGSAARGEAARDVDLALYLDPGLEPGEWWSIAARIAAQLGHGAPCGLEYDVRPLNRSGPAFRHEVVSAGRALYESDPDERAWIEAMWSSEWHDFKPFWDRQTEWVFRRQPP